MNKTIACWRQAIMENPALFISPWWFSNYLIRKYLRAVSGYVRGRVADIGCGTQPYRDLFAVDQYVGIEVTKKSRPAVIGRGEALPLRGNRFDGALLNQVLEHIPDADAAITEARRILKPGGYCIVTVPFIGRLHGQPHDYRRYSEYGVRQLFLQHHLLPVLIRPMGGFLTTQCFLWTFYFYEMVHRLRWRPVKAAAYLLLYGGMIPLNAVSVCCHAIDGEKLTPHNYLAVAQKPLESSRDDSR